MSEFVVYLCEARILSHRRAQSKLNGIALNTGHHVMESAQQVLRPLQNTEDEEAAERVHLPVGVFLEEILGSKVAVLEDPGALGLDLESLSTTFGAEAWEHTVQESS